MVAFLYCFSCVIMLFVTLLTLAKRFFPDGKTEMEIMLDERCSNLPKINEQAYQTLIESEIGEYIRIGAYIIDVSDWLTEHPGGPLVFRNGKDDQRLEFQDVAHSQEAMQKVTELAVFRLEEQTEDTTKQKMS